MRNAHAVANQKRRMSDYTWLSSMDKAKVAQLGHTYFNDQAGLRFIEYIADIQHTNDIGRITLF